MSENPFTPAEVLGRRRGAVSEQVESLFAQGKRLDSLGKCPFCEDHCVENDRHYDPVPAGALLDATDDLLSRIEETLSANDIAVWPSNPTPATTPRVFASTPVGFGPGGTVLGALIG